MTEETFLFLDTETTGFKKSGALIQEGQARVCQLALILTDADGGVITKFSSLIKPDGWKILEGAFKVHGITDEQCEKYGLPYKDVIGMVFLGLANNATVVVAHNEEFDRNMLDIEFAHATFPVMTSKYKWFCTMKSNTHLKGGRWPKLSEAYRHYMDKELVDAHDALVDAEACKDIFFAMKVKNGW